MAFIFRKLKSQPVRGAPAPPMPAGHSWPAAVREQMHGATAAPVELRAEL